MMNRAGGRKFNDSTKSQESMEDEIAKSDSAPLIAVTIIEEILRQVQRELCLIKLCWTDIPRMTEDHYLRSLPDTYRCVSNKERLLLWYAENFRRQFHAKYASRRPLLMACDNECGIQKFVSTSIRRSTLPYPQLHKWHGCAKFISDYIDYQPPDEVFFMPKYLRSPTWVLNFQMGNSFECATLLVSLLLGQSYNAYVVSGYASREQVLCDMTRRICPYLPEKEQTLLRIEMPKIVKYQLKPSPDFRSQFLLELENREKRKIEDDLRQQEEERQRMIAEFEHPRPDKYFGNRIHAWVVILPEEKGVQDREITEPIFIEPSSGNSYNPTDDKTNLLYLGVESIWNDQNYWINMQSCEKSCAKIIWDLNKIELWEHLLPGEPRATRQDTDEIAEDVGVEQDKHLDMPASYVSEIHLNDLDFEKQYPQGSKTIFYKKVKVELYAPQIEMDGLIQRVTIYEDYEYTIPIQSYENYLNRSDCLTESKKHFETNIVTDYFIKGRLDHCKTHRYLASGNNTMDSESVIDFYDSAQFDGLSRVEMGPFYLTLYYTDRDDFLYYRHAQYSTDKGNSIMDGIHFRRISKIVEKYHRNKEIPACKDIAEREFTMTENEICIKFHYNEGQNSRATRTFIKPSIADRGDRLIFDLAMTHGYNPDPTALPEKNLDLFYDLNKHLVDEDYSISCIRDAETEIATFLKKRANENINPQLTISLFDKTRAMKIVAELGTEFKPTQKDVVRKPLNPSNPYFARIGDPSYTSKAEAYLLRDECLYDFKELTTLKANRLVSQINKLYSTMEKVQALLTQSKDLSKAEEEQMLTKINEMSFDIHVLETYLNRHRDMVSKKYRLLLDRLQQHPQLQVLQK